MNARVFIAPCVVQRVEYSNWLTLYNGGLAEASRHGDAPEPRLIHRGEIIGEMTLHAKLYYMVLCYRTIELVLAEDMVPSGTTDRIEQYHTRSDECLRHRHCAYRLPPPDR